jgi:hypothetical protein
MAILPDPQPIRRNSSHLRAAAGKAGASPTRWALQGFILMFVCGPTRKKDAFVSADYGWCAGRLSSTEERRSHGLAPEKAAAVSMPNSADCIIPTDANEPAS